MEDERPFSVGQLIKGFFAGLLIGAACLALDLLLGLVLGGTHFRFLGSVVIAFLLIGIAAVAVKRSRDSGFLRGMLISISLAFIVCTICGVAVGTGPLRF
jgi:hypothetical protein